MQSPHRDPSATDPSYRSGHRPGSPGLLRPLLTSAQPSRRLAAPLVTQDSYGRSPVISSTAFHARPLNLPPGSLMDMGFAIMCSLARPRRPLIQFLFISPRFCSTLPSDPASRRRPCASLSLHLHRVVKRTSTSKLSNMHGVHKKAAPFLGPQFKRGEGKEGNFRKGDARHHPASRDGLNGDVENNGE